ncbi:MAG: glycosyltransferase family 39 protein, partial [Candidatus Omnitrophica bacterium]|nr:glycosyltransferase family 39 protein [Candidatus Omnitrophota bacterium]
MGKNRELNFFILLSVLSFTIFLTTLNKYWAPFDEGIVTVGAERILAGEVPYRDFFIIMYPPGQIYALSLLYKLFGISLGIGRLYTCFIQTLLVMCVFLITKALTGRQWIAFISWAISLTSLGPRMGVVPFPIFPGVAFSLLSIFLFMRYIENGKARYVFYSGIWLGVGALFRHDIAAYAFLAVFASILMHTFAGDKTGAMFGKSFIGITGFIASFMLPVFSALLYLYFKSATKDLFDSLVLFPFIHEKTAAIPFPKPCLNPGMIFHKSIYFIKANQYYLPLVVYAFIALFLAISFIKKRKFGKTDIALSSLLIFGIFSFNQVKIRTDPAHLLTSIHPAVALFGFMLNGCLSGDYARGRKRYAFILLVVLVSALFLLLVLKNTDKFFKNVFRKPYKGRVVLTHFGRGSVYVPREERNDVVEAVSFIRKNTASGERIYVGNIVNWKDDF